MAVEFGVERNAEGLVANKPRAMGVATMVAGTVTVPCRFVTKDSLIFITHRDSTGRVFENIGARVPGVSFQIDSTAPADTGVSAWIIFEPVA